jgi:acid phosphatase (class A)
MKPNVFTGTLSAFSAFALLALAGLNTACAQQPVASDAPLTAQASGTAQASAASQVVPAMAPTSPAEQPREATPPPYFDAKLLDLGRVLPPAPTNDSAVTRGEIELILKIQKERTAAQKERASADARVSIYRFSDALGNPIAFNATTLPKFDLMFRKVLYEEGAVIQAGKRSFARPRPFVLDSRIEPIVDKPPNGSYPSGHTMWARTVGLMLSAMLPEYREKILARADEYSFNRVVAGVHYPSDVESGKLAATALAAFLYASPAFQADFAEAKKELREALKLPAQP